jgi:hypothetical protein
VTRALGDRVDNPCKERPPGPCPRGCPADTSGEASLPPKTQESVEPNKKSSEERALPPTDRSGSSEFELIGQRMRHAPECSSPTLVVAEEGRTDPVTASADAPTVRTSSCLGAWAWNRKRLHADHTPSLTNVHRGSIRSAILPDPRTIPFSCRWCRGRFFAAPPVTDKSGSESLEEVGWFVPVHAIFIERWLVGTGAVPHHSPMRNRSKRTAPTRPCRRSLRRRRETPVHRVPIRGGSSDAAL